MLYSNHDMLRETLEYDFEQEKMTDYSVLNVEMANYNNIPKCIFATTEYLEMFFRNLIFGENNTLSNRNMLAVETQRATSKISKSQIGTLDCALEEFALLQFVNEKPDATQVEIAKHIGKSERTVKRMTPMLIKRGLLERENGKRNGKWVVKCKL